MKYIEVHFICNPHTDIVTDVLSAYLSDVGFESFVETNNGVLAYIPETLFAESKIKQILHDFTLDAEIDYRINPMEDKNWNEEWEKHYFKPIVIDNKCIIHSTFHEVEGEYDYRIIIDPKMSFGTGHHQTTGLILKEMLSMHFQRKSVLDMGCGTAVLAILSSMRGADKVTAIDIDEWAFNNAMENISLNNVHNISVLLGGAEQLGKETYDIIFANINRNILLQDIHSYAHVLNQGGQLVMSGFYKEDLPAIIAKGEEHGLIFSHSSEMDNWVCAVCMKQ